MFEVVAVHNETDDPTEQTDLMVSWSPSTSIATLSAAQTTGDRLLIDALVNPLVARLTDRDYTEASYLPAVYLERIVIVDTPSREVPTLVRNRADFTGQAIGHPRELRLTLDLRVVAAYDVDVLSACDAVDQLARRAYSQVTGEPVIVRRQTDWAPLDGGISARASFEATGAIAYRGQSSAVKLFEQLDVTVVEVENLSLTVVEA